MRPSSSWMTRVLSRRPASLCSRACQQPSKQRYNVRDADDGGGRERAAGRVDTRFLLLRVAQELVDVALALNDLRA